MKSEDIKGFSGLKRNNAAIINLDEKGYEAARKRREKQMTELELEKRVRSLETKIDMIIDMLSRK